LARRLGDWLSNDEEQLKFVFGHEVQDEDLEEVQKASIQECVCDPYINLASCSSEIALIEDSDGQEVSIEKALKGKPCHMSVQMKDGSLASGRWVRGRREGFGTLLTPRLESRGIAMIQAVYREGKAEGAGRLLMENSDVIQGHFLEGVFHGPARGMRLTHDKTGAAIQQMVWIGRYKAGFPSGTCWTALRGGAWLVGRPDLKGTNTGSEYAFLYPDLQTALFGEWEDGALVSASPAQLVELSHDQGVAEPRFAICDDRHYHLWVSSSNKMRGPPHQPDPLETKMVRVADSAVEGGGQGLFANQDIPAGSIVAFYNGIRMTPEEKSPWEDRAYSIVVEWEEKRLAFPFPWVSKADHMDLPPKYHSSENYTATLAHKLNHSFTPNCRWSNMEHPCYGLVPAILTLDAIKEGEELTVHYQMDMEDAPDWYLQCWEEESTKISCH